MTQATQQDTVVSDARLREMLAGLEGVTPGPWVKGRRSEIVPVDGPAHEVGSPTRGIATSLYALDANHIARLDPDTMRAILTELLRLRTATPAPEWQGMESDARFLIDRLDDFEKGSLSDDIEDACRDFDGHVSPAIERLRDALAALPVAPIKDTAK